MLNPALLRHYCGNVPGSRGSTPLQRMCLPTPACETPVWLENESTALSQGKRAGPTPLLTQKTDLAWLV